VHHEPGVSDVVILRPQDGRVLAPVKRGAEQVAKVPGFDIAPGDVWRLQSQRNGELVEVVAPVATAGGPRGAVAWLRFNPAPAAERSTLVVLGPLLLLAVVLAMVTAAVIKRRTLGALASLSEDIELAASGRLSQVADPMGVKPLKDIVETVNYMLVRLHGAERGESRPPPADRPIARAVIPSPGRGRERDTRTPAAPPSGLAPAPARQLPPEGRLVADANYRVTEAGPECAEILGVRVDAVIGQHLLDAIPDKAIVDAVLKCLSALPSAGEERTAIAPEAKSYGLDIAVRRAGKEQPMTIVLRPVDRERA
jgi:hypothetical protein